MANAANVGQQIYGKGNTAPKSTIGPQWKEFYFDRKAILEAAEESYFGQLSSTTNMPKHMGKAIKKQIFYPLLDDRNVNDQGIDADGATLADGNLYGSSKDTGTILSKMPALTEYGGRVNRVGFHRELIEGTFTEFGFFYEFTQDSIDFDSDDQMMMHMRREAIIAANKMNEDHIQADLLNGAGVVQFCGTATADNEITGEGSDVSEVTYNDIMKLDLTLNENRTPKSLKFITGTRLIDTKTVPNARAMFVGSELELQLRDLKDNFNERAFVPVEKYAAGTTLLKGEIGAIGPFRLVSVPQMQHWAGAGADVTANKGYRETNSKYDIYPMLVVGGSDSYGAPFTTIGFQSSGSNQKFKIITKMPGVERADKLDPYGKTGFSSIQWWYGMLLERTERIAVIKTVAKL